MVIAENPKVEASAYGPINGKFGLWVGTWDETPSGCERMRTLLTSEPIYATADAARAAADALIRDVKASAA